MLVTVVVSLDVKVAPTLFVSVLYLIHPLGVVTGCSGSAPINSNLRLWLSLLKLLAITMF